MASGDMVDVYLKIRFHRPVEAPIIGYGIKAVDGLIIYGTTRRCKKSSSRPARRTRCGYSDFRCAWRRWRGIGSSRWRSPISRGQDFPVDNRLDLIHLQVYNAPAFTGLINLEAGLEEIPPAPRILSSDEADQSSAWRLRGSGPRRRRVGRTT